MKSTPQALLLRVVGIATKWQGFHFKANDITNFYISGQFHNFQLTKYLAILDGVLYFMNTASTNGCLTGLKQAGANADQ